jgi:UTP:GlnB (protein PII) uridylyltransferase
MQSHTVRSTVPFRNAIGATGDLNAEISRQLRTAPSAAGMPDLNVEFDNDSSPWYTLCVVRGEDRPRLLHTVAVGFANAGVTVHSARIETIGGVAIDRFELTDISGRKLNDDLQHVARDAIWSGSAPAETRRSWFARLRTV